MVSSLIWAMKIWMNQKSKNLLCLRMALTYMPTTDSSSSSDSSDEPDPSTAKKARKRKSTFQTKDIASSEDTAMVVQEVSTSLTPKPNRKAKQSNPTNGTSYFVAPSTLVVEGWTPKLVVYWQRQSL
ncbi:hypothetical protein QE152_g29054 [Popillia japonica]|uniref:Uncharacterized protein n=1 Tax=Popillia japonica TaxID=7064 RepID=A0AAW1JIY0_POPJA